MNNTEFNNPCIICICRGMCMHRYKESAYIASYTFSQCVYIDDILKNLELVNKFNKWWEDYENNT